MTKNMGTIDRAVRVLIAVAVAVLYFTGQIGGTLAAVLGADPVVRPERLGKLGPAQRQDVEHEAVDLRLGQSREVDRLLSRAAADVENSLAGRLGAAQQLRDVSGASGRHETLAPDQLQHLHHVGVIFVFVGHQLAFLLLAKRK